MDNYEQAYNEFEESKGSVIKKVGRNLPTQGIWFSLIPLYLVMIFYLKVTEFWYYLAIPAAIAVFVSIGKQEKNELLVPDQKTAISIVKNALLEKQDNHSKEFGGLLEKGKIIMTGYCRLRYWDKLAHLWYVGWNLKDSDSELHKFVSVVDPHSAGITGNMKRITEFDASNIKDRETWIPPEFRKDMKYYEKKEGEG